MSRATFGILAFALALLVGANLWLLDVQRRAWEEERAAVDARIHTEARRDPKRMERLFVPTDVREAARAFDGRQP